VARAVKAVAVVATVDRAMTADRAAKAVAAIVIEARVRIAKAARTRALRPSSRLRS
jgi:hypothetical protein